MVVASWARSPTLSYAREIAAAWIPPPSSRTAPTSIATFDRDLGQFDAGDTGSQFVGRCTSHVTALVALRDRHLAAVCDEH
jgi:hypothetical protein